MQYSNILNFQIFQVTMVRGMCFHVLFYCGQRVYHSVYKQIGTSVRFNCILLTVTWYSFVMFIQSSLLTAMAFLGSSCASFLLVNLQHDMGNSCQRKIQAKSCIIYNHTCTQRSPKLNHYTFFVDSFFCTCNRLKYIEN